MLRFQSQQFVEELVPFAICDSRLIQDVIIVIVLLKLALQLRESVDYLRRSRGISDHRKLRIQPQRRRTSRRDTLCLHFAGNAGDRLGNNLTPISRQHFAIGIILSFCIFVE